METRIHQIIASRCSGATQSQHQQATSPHRELIPLMGHKATTDMPHLPTCRQSHLSATRPALRATHLPTGRQSDLASTRPALWATSPHRAIIPFSGHEASASKPHLPKKEMILPGLAQAPPAPKDLNQCWSLTWSLPKGPAIWSLTAAALSTTLKDCLPTSNRVNKRFLYFKVIFILLYTLRIVEGVKGRVYTGKQL